MRRVLVVMVALAFSTRSARAGELSDPKSASTAFWLSAGATLGAATGLFFGYESTLPTYSAGGTLETSSASSTGRLVIVGAGVLALEVAPTIGHIYARHPWSTWLGIKVAGLAVISGALLTAPSHCGDWCALPNDLAAVFVVGGLSAVGIVGEIASAPGAARQYNTEHQLNVSFGLVPIRDARSATAGFGLVGRF
jgi:hypothetical protein